MFEVIFLIVLAVVWIGAATICDLKSREVPNWINFSLIIFALGFRFFYSLFSQNAQGFSFFYQGLIGFGIFFALGNALYYGKMFGGGDAKLIYAFGAILPFTTNLMTNLSILLIFFILFLFTGAAYGIVTSAYLGIKNFKLLKKEFPKQFKKKKKFVYLALFAGLILMVLGFIENLLFFIGLFLFVIPYLYIYAKSVDEVCMVRPIKTNKLREGDWLYEDVKIGKRIIKNKWEGLNNEEIQLIKKSRKEVLLRHGIAFVPVFFFAFLILICLWFLKPELFDLTLWNSLW